MFTTLQEGANSRGRNRKIFTDSFKKEVSLEALKERNTVNEIAAKYGISASLVSSWKKELLSGVFSKEVKQLKKGLAEAQQRIGGNLQGAWERGCKIVCVNGKGKEGVIGYPNAQTRKSH